MCTRYNKGEAKDTFHVTDRQLATLPKRVELTRGYRFRYETHWYKGGDLLKACLARFGSYAAMLKYASKLKGRKRAVTRAKKREWKGPKKKRDGTYGRFRRGRW